MIKRKPQRQLRRHENTQGFSGERTIGRQSKGRKHVRGPVVSSDIPFRRHGQPGAIRMTNPADLDPRQVATLRAIMKALRRPGTGCPWDLEQNFATIAPYTIEEAYEVADAIERSDKGDLREELGDLLLQAVYHAQLPPRRKAFDFDDVVEAICRKMIRRHPHVFGDEKARSAKLAKGFWEEIKAREKKNADACRHPRRRAGGPAGHDARRQIASQGRQGRLRLASHR